MPRGGARAARRAFPPSRSGGGERRRGKGHRQTRQRSAYRAAEGAVRDDGRVLPRASRHAEVDLSGGGPAGEGRGGCWGRRTSSSGLWERYHLTLEPRVAAVWDTVFRMPEAVVET